MTPPDTAVRDLYARLLEAWNAHDADRYGALFAPDAMIVGFDGSQASGAAAAVHVRDVFDDHVTARYVAKVRQVRPLGSEAVLVHAIAGMVPPGQDRLNPGTNAVHTLVAERHDDGWRVVLFQNTPAQYHGRPELTEQHTAELEPLVDSDTIVA